MVEGKGEEGGLAHIFLRNRARSDLLRCDDACVCHPVGDDDGGERRGTTNSVANLPALVDPAVIPSLFERGCVCWTVYVDDETWSALVGQVRQAPKDKKMTTTKSPTRRMKRSKVEGGKAEEGEAPPEVRVVPALVTPDSTLPSSNALPRPAGTSPPG